MYNQVKLEVFYYALHASLVATIKQQRPELLPDLDVIGKPIPQDMPAGFFEKHSFYVEDIGEPTLACFITSTNVDPTNWYFSSLETPRWADIHIQHQVAI